MNDLQAREYLEQSLKFGIRLGLERMTRLMELLGNPERELTCIHIAGTNGKGSVTAMTGNCLAAGGMKVGIYTSPYIERFTERIRILDGRAGLERFSMNEEEGEITKQEFALILTRIKQCVDQMLAEGAEHPTEFELITAAAFLFFKEKGCQAVVLETGLGGRLDSTNVIQNPLKCVLTAITYDHTDRLGNTIREIASEKAGIIKTGADVLLYDPNEYTTKNEADEILSVIREKCAERHAKSFTVISSKRIRTDSVSIEGQRFYYQNPDRPDMPETEYFTTLLGLYQPMNCLMAIETCRDLVPEEAVIEGIRVTRWPARMERILAKEPLSFLDGGHNPQGASALRETIERLLPGCRIVFLCGVMADKEYQKMLTTLLSSDQYRVEAVFCTKPDNPRALSASNLAKTVSEILDNLAQTSYNRLAKVFFNEDLEAVTRDALQAAVDQNAIFIAFGSLYMAGKIRYLVKSLHRKRFY